MRLTLVARKVIVWILGACLALGAMAPAVSQVLEAHGRGPLGWDAICTQLGTRLNDRSGAPSGTLAALAARQAHGLPQPAESAGHLFNHCLYCAIHWTAWGPPMAPAVPVPTAWAHRVTQPAVRVVRTSAAWLKAQPRGPPAST